MRRRSESWREGKSSRRREPSAGRNHHPWAVAGRGRRQSLPLVQQSHPTRFVAGAGNLWHTSAHKGNPLFRRRAPAPSTVDPRGLLTIRAAPEGRQAVRRPFAINGRNTDQWNGGERHSWRNDLLVPWPVSARRNAHTVAEGDARWGVPRGGTVCLAVSEIPARQRCSLASGRLGRSAPFARGPALARRGIGWQGALAIGIAAA